MIRNLTSKSNFAHQIHVFKLNFADVKISDILVYKHILVQWVESTLCVLIIPLIIGSGGQRQDYSANSGGQSSFHVGASRGAFVGRPDLSRNAASHESHERRDPSPTGEGRPG